MSNLLKNLLIALGLSIIIFVGYLTFIRDDGSSTHTQTATSATVELETQQLLSMLNELKSLDVNGELFSDPLFLSLKDFREALGEEPSGRPDPFAVVR